MTSPQPTAVQEETQAAHATLGRLVDLLPDLTPIIMEHGTFDPLQLTMLAGQLQLSLATFTTITAEHVALHTALDEAGVPRYPPAGRTTAPLTLSERLPG